MHRLFLFVLLPIILWGQIRYLPVYADYASFFSTDTTTYVEIYVSVYQGNLSYLPLKEGLGYEASFNHKVTISKNGKVIRAFQRKYHNSTQDTSQLARFNQFVDIFRAELPYDDYSVKVETIDNHSSLRGEYNLDLKPIRPSDNIFLSDIEFCSEIARDTTQNTFFKNNCKVIPNPRRIYDILHPLLYYYVELHNLPYSPDLERRYKYSYYITNVDGDTLKSRKPILKKVINANQVEIGGLNVMALPKGVYFFNIDVEDAATGDISTAKRKFFVYKPERKKKAEAIVSSELPDIDEVFSGMTREELMEEFDMARYIATKTEERVFDNLENENAMRKYLTDFWRRRDKENYLPYGTSRTTYLRNAAYANEKFGYMGKKGWKTDRGRVLMTYGEPDEFERFPNTMNMVPYVVWRYHSLEGGAIFVFADLSGFGEYRLVHSTHRQELQNPEWLNQIQQGNSRQIEGYPGF